MKILPLLAILVLAPGLMSFAADTAQNKSQPGFAVGQQAPDFAIKDSNGNVINLADLTAKGPVLVRLTCGCLGCDRELPYFQEVQRAYESQGLTSLAIFKEGDAKVEAYVRAKKLNMLYAVDSKGESWTVFKTRKMPTNFLIEQGGRIAAIAAGCDPSGVTAARISEKAAVLTASATVDVKAKVQSQKAAQTETNAAAK